jgi:succinylglutamate desuccinylase
MAGPFRPGASLHALARGDFSMWASAFTHAGFSVSTPAEGMLCIYAGISDNIAKKEETRLLLSAGIHGDETAPVELLAGLLDELAAEPSRLRTSVMFVIGNPAAIALQKRFVDADLNRMFRSGTKLDDSIAETSRALRIMHAVDIFFSSSPSEKIKRIHLDLHTAIRASLYPAFALVPSVVPALDQPGLFDWLSAAAMQAVVVNGKPAGTFTAYTAERFSAAAATLELGRVSEMRKNDLAPLEPVGRSLLNLLRGIPAGKQQGQSLAVFDVVGEIVRSSAAFQLFLDSSVPNFTALSKGTLVASDGSDTYRVERDWECVLFPNPDVAIGQRAGLMLAPRTPASGKSDSKL